MSLQGPVVVIADQKDTDLVAALAAADAFPVVEASWRDGASAAARIEPAAVLLPDHVLPDDILLREKLARAVAAMNGPYMPVIARITPEGTALDDVLPVAADAPAERIVERLAAALRVRTQHATALRRAESLAAEVEDLPVLPDTDPLDDATVVVAGRGRSYPALATAFGERVGLIGALAVETAAKHLASRDVDGIMIGDGFGWRAVETFLSALSDDSRFRDLPVGVLGDVPSTIDRSRLPNLERLDGEASAMVERMLPLVRQHAFEARLRRQLAALDAKGLLDSQTGLFTVRAFLRDLDKAVTDTRERGIGLSLARFSFPPEIDRRASLDAARLVSRLVRSVDFACRAGDGSILLVFSGTGLRHAHVVARRIASVLKHTMLLSDNAGSGQIRIDPAVTLAALKSNDTIESLLARVSEPTPVAAA
jgi:GGDEF domain-containing protein